MARLQLHSETAEQNFLAMSDVQLTREFGLELADGLMTAIKVAYDQGHTEVFSSDEPTRTSAASIKPLLEIAVTTREQVCDITRNTARRAGSSKAELSIVHVFDHNHEDTTPLARDGQPGTTGPISGLSNVEPIEIDSASPSPSPDDPIRSSQETDPFQGASLDEPAPSVNTEISQSIDRLHVATPLRSLRQLSSPRRTSTRQSASIARQQIHDWCVPSKRGRGRSRGRVSRSVEARPSWARTMRSRGTGAMGSSLQGSTADQLSRDRTAALSRSPSTSIPAVEVRERDNDEALVVTLGSSSPPLIGDSFPQLVKVDDSEDDSEEIDSVLTEKNCHPRKSRRRKSHTKRNERQLEARVTSSTSTAISEWAQVRDNCVRQWNY